MTRRAATSVAVSALATMAASVRARDASGRIVATTTTDHTGHFAFLLERAGTYYVEVVDETGRAGRLPAAALGTTLRTILGAASAAGIAAFAASGQPASPER